MARGYSSYRGRKSKWKGVAAFLLVLIILAAAGFMAMQRYIVYDDMGVPHLTLPGAETTPEAPETLPNIELDVEEPAPQTLPFRAVALAEAPLTAEALQTLPEGDAAWDGVLAVMKDAVGKVYFDSAEARSGTVKVQPGTAEALVLLTNRNHAIAQVSCFRDPQMANLEARSMGLLNKGGYLFYDGNNTCWIDPGKPAVRDYLCGIMVELAAMGFEEILLTDVSYPTVGKLEAIRYGDVPKEQNLLDFLMEVNTALEPYDVTLSIEVPEAVLTTGQDETAGLVLADLVTQVDRIYAVTTAEQAEQLAECVLAASEAAEFVPILSGETGEANRYLLVSPVA